MKSSWVGWFVWFCSCAWLRWLPAMSDVLCENHTYLGYKQEESEDETEAEEAEKEKRSPKSFKGLLEKGVLEHGTIVVCKKHVEKQGVVRVASGGKKCGIEYEGVVYSYTEFLKVVCNGGKGNPWKLLYTIDEDGALLDSFESLWSDTLRISWKKEE